MSPEQVVLWFLKGLLGFGMAALVLGIVYRRGVKPPETKFRCAKCGMPDWAIEEKCWYGSCPSKQEKDVQ